jgi:hypothetical protein
MAGVAFAGRSVDGKRLGLERPRRRLLARQDAANSRHPDDCRIPIREQQRGAEHAPDTRSSSEAGTATATPLASARTGEAGALLLATDESQERVRAISGGVVGRGPVAERLRTACGSSVSVEGGRIRIRMALFAQPTSSPGLSAGS